MTGNLRCVCVCMSVSELLDVMTVSLHRCNCRRTNYDFTCRLKKNIYLLMKKDNVAKHWSCTARLILLSVWCAVCGERCKTCTANIVYGIQFITQEYYHSVVQCKDNVSLTDHLNCRKATGYPSACHEAWRFWTLDNMRDARWSWGVIY